jgi:hypothetical protein
MHEGARLKAHCPPSMSRTSVRRIDIGSETTVPVISTRWARLTSGCLELFGTTLTRGWC